MRSKVYFGVAVALVCFLSVVGLAAAQDEAAKVQVGAAAQAVPDPTSFITQHTGQFNGEQISYTVTAGETYLRDEDGEPKAANVGPKMRPTKLQELCCRILSLCVMSCLGPSWAHLRLSWALLGVLGGSMKAS